MSFKIDQPNILGKSEAEQLQQVKTYLFQLAGQLNWALNTLESGTDSGKIVTTNGQPITQASTEKEVQATFNSIKSLIIKSADIVEAYYQETSRRLEGLYVAESDFGAYQEQTAISIQENSKAIENFYTNIQQILTDIENLENNLIEVSAHIKSGLLYYNSDGVPIYGLEIGQKNTLEGVEVFNKYARFVADRLSFYDQNDTEVAYISNFMLYITHVTITGSLSIGRFVFDTSNGGLAIKWV